MQLVPKNIPHYLACLWGLHKQYKERNQIPKKKQDKCIRRLKLTDIGDSAPRLLSRKNEAESIDATVKIIGFELSEDEILIGRSDDHTLPFIIRMWNVKFKEKQ